MLQFCDLPWNSTPEEVLQLLNLSESDARWTETEGTSFDLLTLTLPGWEIFGQTPENISLRFVRWHDPGTAYGLDIVEIHYAGKEDFSPLLQNISQIYGGPIDTVTEITLTSDHTGTYWISTETYATAFSDDIKEAVRKAYCEKEDPISQEGYAQCMEAAVARIHWSEDAFPHVDTLPDGMTRNILLFDASGYVQYLQQYGS